MWDETLDFDQYQVTMGPRFTSHSSVCIGIVNKVTSSLDAALRLSHGFGVPYFETLMSGCYAHLNNIRSYKHCCASISTNDYD